MDQKIQKTKERDESAYHKLRLLGWNVIVAWECQLKPSLKENMSKAVTDILYKSYLEIYKI